MPITNIRSEWVSGNLVFYEEAVGQSVTGDVLTLGTTAVKVGGTSQDVDFQFYATGSKSFIIDAGAGTVTLVGLTQAYGSKANVSGSGITIPSTDDWGAFRVFTDDAGANIADSVRGIQSRTLLTISQSAGTIRALQGQLKAIDGVNFATGVYTPVQGYIELVGSQTVASTGVLTCFDASIEIGTALTATGYVAGFKAELTGSGTITGAGGAGVLVTNASGAAAWPNAMFVESGACTAGLVFGEKSSAAAIGHHIGVANSADTAGDKAIAVFADDANAVLASDAQGINSRCLILHAQTGAYGMTALRGHLRVVASVTPSGSKGFYGTESYVEASGTYTLGGAGVFTVLAAAGACIELGGTPTISANAVACGLHVTGKTMPASPTGESVGVLFQAITQGFEHTFGFTGVGSTDGNGLVTQSGGTNTYTHKIAVWINGVGTKYIGVGDIA